MSKLLPAIVLLSTASCAHVLSFNISGNAIADAGETFVETSQAFDNAFEADVITADQYAQWKAFGLKFQMAYPAAVDLWHVAVLTNDDAMQANAMQAMTNLIGPLSDFAAQIAVIVKTVMPRQQVDGGVISK